MWLLIKFKLMYILFFLQIFLFLFGTNDQIDIIQITTCPVDNAINKSIAEDFITKPYWSEERQQTGAENLTTSQISLLTDANDGTACTSFNTTYEEALEEENSPGEKAYNVTYYKVDTFYFVVISIRQPANETYIATGINYIHIYDHQQDLIEAYAF